jgi:hypothetical protein
VVPLLVPPRQALAGILFDIVPNGEGNFTSPTQQALLSLAAGCNVGAFPDGSSRGGAGSSQSQLSLTDLVVTLFMRLWDLLADQTIMGRSDRPAGWLLPTSTYLEGSRQCIMDMMTAVQGALAAAGTTNSLSQSEPAPATNAPATTAAATNEQPVSGAAISELQGVLGEGLIQVSGNGSSSRGGQPTSSPGTPALRGQGSAPGHASQPLLTSASHLSGNADAAARLVEALRPRVPWHIVWAALCAHRRAGARAGLHPILQLGYVYNAIQHAEG